MSHLVVDAMNVIGTRPTGWWRDRDGAIRLLVERLQRFAAEERCAVTVVVDGRPLHDLPEGAYAGVQVLYATRGRPDAADDRIIELIEAHREPASLEVVTSDRELIQRAVARGARVRRSRALLERLDEVER